METKRRQEWAKPWTWNLHWQILLGLVVGAAAGWGLTAWARSAATADVTAAQIVRDSPFRLVADMFGTLFLNGLKVIVIPLVTSSMILSVAAIGRRAGFARLGLKTLVYICATSTIAILIGLCLVNVFQPGVADGDAPLMTPASMASFKENFEAEAKQLGSSVQLERAKTGEGLLEKVLSIFKRLVPANPVQAMVEMDLLGLIVLSLLGGYFLSHLPDELRGTMTRFWQGVYEISFGLTGLVMRFAPLGVGCLLASTLSLNLAKLSGDGRILDFVNALKSFGLVAATGLLVHVLFVLPLILYLFTGIGPIRFFTAVLPALVTAFSTSSSNATISVSLDCVENRAGVSKEISSFIIPVGATVNMNGTALYECVAAIFVVQLFGLQTQIDFATQLLVVLIALLTSVGVAGVPSASLVAIVIILDSVTKQLGLEFQLADALPILLILDRPLDMLRTSVNVAGDLLGAVLIARTEGERPLAS